MMKRKTGPPHKPMTYVEQLQKLNQGAPKTTSRAGNESICLSLKSFLNVG